MFTYLRVICIEGCRDVVKSGLKCSNTLSLIHVIHMWARETCPTLKYRGNSCVLPPPPHFYHQLYFDWFVPPTFKIVPAPLICTLIIFTTFQETLLIVFMRCSYKTYNILSDGRVRDHLSAIQTGSGSVSAKYRVTNGVSGSGKLSHKRINIGSG